MNNIFEKALEDYLDYQWPLQFIPGLSYKDTPAGRSLHKSEQSWKRQKATEHFTAGYLAAFVAGNVSPNSDFLVVVSKKAKEDE